MGVTQAHRKEAVGGQIIIFIQGQIETCVCQRDLFKVNMCNSIELCNGVILDTMSGLFLYLGIGGFFADYLYR